MKHLNFRIVCAIAAVFAVVLAGGCAEPGQGSGRSKLLGTGADLGPTIGSLARIYSAESTEVEGYGMVGGLQGTGSPDCPPALRSYLKKYILRQLPNRQIDVNKLIDSYSTAVVRVTGQTPALTSKGQDFDVKVAALEGSQTISLEGGWLYRTDLRVAGRLAQATRAVAGAGGPVFTNRLGDVKMSRKEGYVLGGASVFEDTGMTLVLNKPDFETTGRIRNRINERFGFGVARAAARGRIELTVPPRYARQRQRFKTLVEKTYLTENPRITSERILKSIRDLAASKDKNAGEIALEAIGNASLGKLAILLNSSDESVRLHAARCMLNLGGNEGLGALIEIALDRSSPLRVDALEALTASAARNDAAAISRRLLADPDFDVRLAAYQQLIQLQDFAVTSKFVGRSFYLDRVMRSPYKGIFVSRRGQPRIALLGAPIKCREDVFVQSEDAAIILNAPRGRGYMSVMRKHPSRRGAIATLKSSLDLADIIQTLCEEPTGTDEKGRGGLGVSYSDMIALVKQLSDKGAVQAEYRAGPMPKISVNIKK